MTTPIDASPSELLLWLRANTSPGPSLEAFRAMPAVERDELLFLLLLEVSRSVVDLERVADDDADAARRGRRIRWPFRRAS